MRWRFADRIDVFEPWAFIEGRKGVSLEEYSLLERHGREGALPESLVLETCVHFARHLVERSSDYRHTGLVGRIGEFVFDSPAVMGDNLRARIEAVPGGRTDASFCVRCRIEAAGRPVAHGELRLDLIPLGEVQDAGALKIMWGELYGTAS